jgi:hypothetical protein
MEAFGIVIFVVVIIISQLLERMAQKQKQGGSSNPLENESAEDFFKRLATDKDKKKRKTKKETVSLKLIEPETQAAGSFMSTFEKDTKDEWHTETANSSKMKNKNTANSINLKDKKSLRKAIIINMILEKPSAYKM